MEHETMKKEYNFSKGVRGKFYRPNAKFNVPIYLDGKVRQFVERIAERKRTDVSAVVNRMLRSEMDLVEAAKMKRAGRRAFSPQVMPNIRPGRDRRDHSILIGLRKNRASLPYPAIRDGPCSAAYVS